MDLDYYRNECDKAIEAINEYYPFDDFVNYVPMDFLFIPKGSPEEVPFDAMNPPTC